MGLDIDFVRSQFPGLAQGAFAEQSFFENAGGSLPCGQTVDALHRFYLETKVQPYAEYGPSRRAGEAMDTSRARWAEALGVDTDQVQFGPSTSMNTYVLAAAFGERLGPGDEVVVTNQDHEANTGAMRRMVERVGATLREWRVDPATGLLDPAGLADLLTDSTAVVCFPHCSNIVGQENDVAALVEMVHSVGAKAVVDAVSYAPHSLADVGALGADVYMFSLYKVYSVHQGLMVTGPGLADELANQGHYFNSGLPGKRLTPAGPDHAQEAAAGAVLDYVWASHIHHGGSPDAELGAASRHVSKLWRDHETALVEPVLDRLASLPGVRVVGPTTVNADGPHRCPTVAFVVRGRPSAQVAAELVERGIMCGSGDFYARRLIEAVDIDPYDGVVRLSWVHYTTQTDIDRLLTALGTILPN